MYQGRAKIQRIVPFAHLKTGTSLTKRELLRDFFSWKSPLR